MSNWKKFAPYVVGGMTLVAFVASVRAPRVLAATRAALTEIVIPSQTFHARLYTLNSPVVAGPGTGTLGITNLVLTNFDTTKQQVYIFPAIMSSAGCSGSVIGGGDGGMTVYLQPQETLVIPYPTPMKYEPLSGSTCVGAEVTTLLHGGSVEVDVNGFVN